MNKIFTYTLCMAAAICTKQVVYAQELRLSIPKGIKYEQVKIDLKNTNDQLVHTIPVVSEAIILNEYNLSFPLCVTVTAPACDVYLDTLHDISEVKFITLIGALEQLDDVVVTGQYESTAASKSIHAIKVLNREHIDLMQAQNLKDVLTNELNIRLQQDNVLGSSMQLQGLTGQNIKLLIDGVPVIGRLDGNIDISQINLNNVERIEIVEGPMAVNYGTDALGGAINIITKTHAKYAQEFKINNYYESIGTYNTDIFFSKKINNKWSTNANLGRYYFDGWSPNDAAFEYVKEHYADSSRYHAWKPKEQYFGNLGFRYQGKRLSAHIKSALFTEEIINKGLPRLPLKQMSIDDYYNTTRWVNDVNLSYKFSERVDGNLLMAYSDYNRKKNTYIKDLQNLFETLSNNPQDQDTTLYKQWMSRGNLFYSIPALSKIKFENGFEATYENMIGAKMSKDAKELIDVAGFMTFAYQVNKNMTLKPGFRYGYNTLYNAPFIPSLHLRYIIPMAKSLQSLTLRASYARGFRAPGLKELYYDFVDINHNIQGNQQLEAEYSNTFNVNAIYQSLHNDVLCKLTGSMYYNKVENLIQLAAINNAATQYTYTNIGLFRSHGGNLLGEVTTNNFKWVAGLGLMGIYNISSEQNAAIKSYAYTPEIKTNFIYKYKKWDMDFSVFYKYTGQMLGFSVDQNDAVVTRKMNAYSMLDLDLRKGFWNKRLLLGIGCKNVLNVTNITSNLSSGGAHSGGSSSVPLAMGRNYFIKAAIHIY